MKLKLLVTGATLCALGITGCTKEADEAGSLAGKPVVMTMQSSAVELDTRADYANNTFSWRKGDKMSVVIDGVSENKNCVLTTSEEGKDAPFSGKVIGWDGSKDIYAFYPYSSTGYAVSNGNVTFTMPNSQIYTIGGAIDNSFMVGTGTATVTDGTIKASVSMKQVMSIIKLNITNAPGKVTGVRLICTEAIFPTKATVAMGTGVTTNPNDLVQELSMSVTDNTSETTKSVSFAMLPANLTGKTIKIEVTFDGSTTKAITKSGINFARNTHYLTDFDATMLPYVEMGGLKWATGNLVADGAHGAKIGSPKDYGLIFQFGSLIGWNEAITNTSPSIVVKPVNFEGKEDWSDMGKIWQGTPGTAGVVPFTVAGSGSAEEKAGVGDPCRYYLKGTWRLPTKDEFKALFNVTSDIWYWSSLADWSWNSGFISHTNGFTLPAAGLRNYGDGSSDLLTSRGYYWSSTLSASGGSPSLYFDSRITDMGNDNLSYGFSVRCVQE